MTGTIQDFFHLTQSQNIAKTGRWNQELYVVTWLVFMISSEHSWSFTARSLCVELDREGELEMYVTV